MWVCYLGVQTVQVRADVLDAGSKRVDVQEGWNDPWSRTNKWCKDVNTETDHKLPVSDPPGFSGVTFFSQSSITVKSLLHVMAPD